MTRAQKWITENFEQLVADYGGKYIAVVGEKVTAVALTPKEAMEVAMRVAKEKEISETACRFPRRSPWGVRWMPCCIPAGLWI